MTLTGEITLDIQVISPADLKLVVTASPWPYYAGRLIHVAAFAYLKPWAEYADLIPCPFCRVKFYVNDELVAEKRADGLGYAGIAIKPTADVTVKVVGEWP